MDENYLLNNKTAKSLYQSVKTMPIIDYHCHLSPKEIYENKVFDNIGEMWLAGDHYKWRLMRAAGVDEKYITGDASWREKFIQYASTVEFAAGNPLYHWSRMELSRFFAIETPLKKSTAADIYDRANAYIKENALTPRKIIEQSRVEKICTTDDPTDDLFYHKKIKQDGSFPTEVLPSFRTDNLLLIQNNNYKSYLKKLENTTGIKINGLNAFKQAIENRLDYFIDHGCKFTDVGIPFFPNHVLEDDKADRVFKAICNGASISSEDYLGFIGNMYLFLGKIYKARDLIMQWHLAVSRNASSILFERLGADCGGDCVGDAVNGRDLIKMLDALEHNDALPQTIIYTLNPANAAQIASIAGAFPNVRCGAAWWFCDHKRGIEEELNIISENGILGRFYGMLTDSRSFLSYARHDYFRRILCSVIGNWVESDEFDEDSAEKIVADISYNNIKNVW